MGFLFYSDKICTSFKLFQLISNQSLPRISWCLIQMLFFEVLLENICCNSTLWTFWVLLFSSLAVFPQPIVQVHLLTYKSRAKYSNIFPPFLPFQISTINFPLQTEQIIPVNTNRAALYICLHFRFPENQISSLNSDGSTNSSPFLS